MTKTQLKILEAKKRAHELAGIARFFVVCKILFFEVFVAFHKIGSHFVLGKHRTFEKFAERNEHGIITESFTKHEKFHRISVSSAAMVVVISITYVLAGILAPAPVEIHAASLVVNDNGDTGDGVCDSSCTLRDALETANASVGADAISFNAAMTITPTSALPNITEGVSINGDVDSNGSPDVVINGGSAGVSNGLTIVSDSNTISGLVIQGFSGNGIAIQGSNNTISGNYIGTNSAGTAASANTTDGIVISDDTINPSSGNVIGGNTASARNIISGNSAIGVRLIGSLVTSNTVAGNYIGTNAAGTGAIANGSGGVRIESSANGNTIGGNLSGANPGEAPGNVISGNSSNAGIALLAPSNQVSGNIIGLVAAGTTALPNSGGITISAASNTIGGSSASYRNIISGNAGHGISQSAGATTTVQNNYIGVDMAGTTARANSTRGINLVGGDEDILDNVISGNSSAGIYSAGGSTVTVKGNKIGTNAAGSAAISGTTYGIYALNGTFTIGGTSASDRNIISGNSGYGIVGATGNPRLTIIGNYIGTDVNGTSAIANGTGIIFAGGATGNVIGANNATSACASSCNVISGNTTNEIKIDSASHGNSVKGNYIGINATGTKPLDWTASGSKISVQINDGSYNNQIGGTRDENLDELGEGNVISGNQQSSGAAIALTSNAYNGTTGNPVLGNLIGTSPSGAYQDSYNNTTGAAGSDGINDFGNSVGIFCNASYCGIGDGTTTGMNLISGNTVGIKAESSNHATFNKNYIGTNKTGTGAFSASAYQGRSGLHFGILFDGDVSATSTIVEDNVISGFYKASPDLSGGLASANFGIAVGLGSVDATGESRGITFIKNKIGTDKAGTAVVKNNGGFYCFNGSGITIGSADVADRNIVSGNGESLVGGPFVTTVAASGYCAGNTIQNNYFGTDVTGNVSLGNGNAITLLSATGSTTWDGNVIASSTGDGVVMTDAGNHTFTNNHIGVGADGTTAMGNAKNGMLLSGMGSLTLTNNLIENNTERGVHATNVSGFVVDGNNISNNTSDGIRFTANPNNMTLTNNTISGNGHNGIEADDFSLSTIGGIGNANTISSNALNGIAFLGASHDNTVSYNAINSNGDSGTVNGAGMYIDQSFANTISNNTFDANVRGVALASSSSSSETNTITLNDITNSLSSGVLIQNAGTQNNTISNNTISSNHAYGIDNDTTHSTDNPTPVGGDNVIDSNVISLNLLSGIRNYGASPTLTNNTFTQNVKNGVLNVVNYGASTNPSTASDDTISRPSITGNTFNGNQEYGIYSLDTAPTNKSTLTSDNTYDNNNTLGRIKQEWYGLVQVTVAGTAQDAASVDVLDSTETDNLASITTASNGYAPDTASLSDVQTWQIIPEFQVSPTGTLQTFGPHTIIAAADGDSETISFNFNGVNDSGESVPSGFGNISGRYQVALDNITKTPSTITGTVFVDSNENGTQDSGETGKSGVPLSLYQSSDTTYGGDSVVATTISAADGTYTFASVVNGNYFVVMGLPSGYDQTSANPGDVITFAAENQSATRNFGLAAIPVVTVPSGTIRGTVYEDINKSKTFDSGETALSGMVVRLYADSNSNGTYEAGTDQFLASRTSNASGIYRFIGIHLRNYFLRVDVPSNRSLTTDNSPTDVLALDTDGETITQDFGMTAAVVTPTPTPEPEPTPKPKPGVGGGIISIINTISGGSNPGIVAPKTGASTANTLVAVAAAGLALVNILLATGSSIPILLRLLLDLFTEPLMALFGSKKQPWGKVFDSMTNLPIDLGIVRLYDANTERLTATAVTDRTGRFKFFPKKGLYVAKASKTGYVFPSSLLKSAPTYQKPNYYFGDKFIIDDKNQTFNRDIPIDREDNKGSEKVLLKLRTKQALHTIFAYSGIVISIVNMVILLSWLTFGLFLLHIVLFVIFWRITQPKKPKAWGIVYDEETKKPITGAVVRIFDQRFGRLLDATISNRNGKFGFLIGPSTYYLVVEARGYIFPGTRKSNSKDYIGGSLEIKDANQAISYNIPLRKRPD